MASEAAEVERALLALAPDDRAAVIERGLLSLDEVDPVGQAAIDEAWAIEIERRVNEYSNGDTKLVDAETHFAQVRARLATLDT